MVAGRDDYPLNGPRKTFWSTRQAVLRTPTEIACLQQAGQLVAQALQLAQSMAIPGCLARDIDEAVEAFYLRNGALPILKGYPHPHGRRPFPAAICVSINHEVVHGIPGARRLAAGDIVSLDTSCKFAGWCADSAVTIALGEVPAHIERLLRVGRQTLDLAIAELSARTCWREVAERMTAFVRHAGMSMVDSLVGHGVGRQLHEYPEVPNTTDGLHPDQDFRLEPGLVIAIEPTINLGGKGVQVLSDDWTIVTQDGSPSVHFEHTVAITADGPIVLTRAPATDGRVDARIEARPEPDRSRLPSGTSLPASINADTYPPVG